MAVFYIRPNNGRHTTEKKEKRNSEYRHKKEPKKSVHGAPRTGLHRKNETAVRKKTIQNKK